MIFWFTIQSNRVKTFVFVLSILYVRHFWIQFFQKRWSKFSSHKTSNSSIDFKHFWVTQNRIQNYAHRMLGFAVELILVFNIFSVTKFRNSDMHRNEFETPMRTIRVDVRCWGSNLTDRLAALCDEPWRHPISDDAYV